jgi:hypothetical protein
MTNRNKVPLRYPDGTPIPRDGGGYNMADVANAVPRPLDWGPWMLDPSNRVLKANDDERNEYEIDLDQCLTAPQVLDWIAQVTHKTWADDATVAGLVRALDDVLNLQANFCPSGESRPKLSLEKISERVHATVEQRAQGMRVYPELDRRRH